MSEASTARTRKAFRIRHKGRNSQVFIYLGKQLRFFINQSDWKVLPMAAVIAGLVGMVIRNRFFVNMEGSLIGAFALTCVAIWNGCFNSIQSVCRERAIIKREHRSGMHISSYVAAHMIYQFMLCAAQTALTMFVLRGLGVPIPKEGFITPWMLVDIGITMFLISYAADMMSLFLSSISHTTTGAMTLMPFILIFQLVFSGGVIPLPAWSQSLSSLTISNYGIQALAAQSNYNDMPMTAVWNTLAGMKGTEIEHTITVGQLIDAMDNPVVERNRDKEVLKSFTVAEVADIVSGADSTLHLRDQKVLGELTFGEVLDELKKDKDVAGEAVNKPVTLGELADFIRGNEALKNYRDKSFTLKTTIGEAMDLVGEEKVKDLVQKKTAQAAYKKQYETSLNNILDNWFMICVFIFLFAVLSTIVLELIDKDKR